MTDTVTALPQRSVSREVQSAEAQIANVDEQISEHAAAIMGAEIRIEAMEDQVRKERSFIRKEQRSMDKLVARRGVFIDAASALRKLERP